MPSRSSLLIMFLSALIAAAVVGCRSDAYYQNRAAERAREYLLDEAHELSAEEKYFITFNDPVFLISPIIGSRDFAKHGDNTLLVSELNQICIAWKLPERQEWYMVYGASEGRMDFWHPTRLIRKRFTPPKISGLENATSLARTYARNNLFGLMNTAEQNFIRFHFPAVYETDFALNFNPTGQATEEEIAAARKAAARATQYSLVWEMPGDAELTIFCGTGRHEMNGWKLNFAGKTTAEELRRHTVRRIKTPAEYYMPFPQPYAAPPDKKTAKKGK